MLQGIKILDRLLVVRGVAEVLPVAVVGEAEDTFSGCQQLLDQVGEVEIFALGDVFQHARFEDVESHTDAVVDGWFFDVVSHVAALIHFNHTQVDLDGALVHGNGADGFILFVEPDQLRDRQQGEHIPIGYQEGFGQVGDIRQWSGGAQWKILIGVLDVEVVLRTVLEVGAHQPGEMPNGEGDVVDPGCFELVQQDLEDGFVTDRHHRLGEDFGVGG